METARAPEMLVNLYHTTRRYNPEDFNDTAAGSLTAILCRKLYRGIDYLEEYIMQSLSHITEMLLF